MTVKLQAFSVFFLTVTLCLSFVSYTVWHGTLFIVFLKLYSELMSLFFFIQWVWFLEIVQGGWKWFFFFLAVNNVHPASGSSVSSHQHTDPSRNARINNTYVASHPMENGLPPDPSPPSGYPHQHRSPAAQPSPTVR